MKLLASLAVALTLTLGTMASAQECNTPNDDATEIAMKHGKVADHLLTDAKLAVFARKTGAPEDVIPMLSHIQLWNRGSDYFVAFYVGGCRAGTFVLPLEVAEAALIAWAPEPFIRVLRLRDA